jgi:CubicO group peptidase (beta-lactamase class C family)
MEKNILKIIILFFLFPFTSCLKEDDLKLPFISYQPQELEDGWTISSPNDEQIDGDELEKIYRNFHESDDLWQVRSLLVCRNNNLVSESYTKYVGDITKPTAIWSCTKQVMAILTGIALDNNVIDDVNDNIQKYLPEEISRHPNKGAITIDNLLKMQSGIAFENDGLNGESNKLLREIPDNSLDFVLGLSVFCEQGTTFHYNDGDPHILSAIIQKQTNKTTRDWAKDVLFSKLNMKNYDWLTYKDGITMGAFGILATPREMARFGHLVMNKGIWNGEQIVDSEWIENMTTTKVSASEVGYNDMTFGYYWWIDEGRGIVFMNGHGGQFVFIKPSKNLVVVTTAEPNTQGLHQLTLSKALDLFDRIDNIVN